MYQTLILDVNMFRLGEKSWEWDNKKIDLSCLNHFKTSLLFLLNLNSFKGELIKFWYQLLIFYLILNQSSSLPEKWLISTRIISRNISMETSLPSFFTLKEIHKSEGFFSEWNLFWNNLPDPYRLLKLQPHQNSSLPLLHRVKAVWKRAHQNRKCPLGCLLAMALHHLCWKSVFKSSLTNIGIKSKQCKIWMREKIVNWSFLVNQLKLVFLWYIYF